MPNTRIRDKWEPLVKQIIADLGPRAGPTPILRQLKDRVENLRRGGAQVSTDYPSTRTIQRIKDEFTPEEQREYERFRWPESIEAGVLPWEASAAALELLGIQMNMNQYAQIARANGVQHFAPPEVRPSMRLVRWYWRVTHIAPDLPVYSPIPGVVPDGPGRYDIAKALAVCEAAGAMPQRLRDAVEAYLAYAPWRTGTGAVIGYLMAVDSGQIPRLTSKELYSALEPYFTELAALREWFGSEFAELFEKPVDEWSFPQQDIQAKEETTNGEAEG
jgi:hypothetical protein